MPHPNRNLEHKIVAGQASQLLGSNDVNKGVVIDIRK